MRRDSGSIAPLGIGLSALVVSVIFLLVSIGSLYILRNRLTANADFAALNEVRFGQSAREFVEATLGNGDVRVGKDSTLDGKTVEIELCSNWVPPLPIPFEVPVVEVCGRGAARLG